MRTPRFPSPATVIALAALFFALGGSAFAVGQATLAGQPRCAQGAIRGLAAVAASSSMPATWTGQYLNRKFNCAGKGVQVRRVDAGVYDVRFPGNGSNLALVSAASQISATVTRNPDGSFRVTVFSPEDNDHQQLKGDGQFQLALI
jgi:hypothetical protein